MALRVDVQPGMIRWALERSGRDGDEPPAALRRVDEWQRGDRQPTLKQLQQFATWTHVPFGYFFLDGPPTIDLPLPDFRSMRNQAIGEPSLELVDTVNECLDRQDWYREYMQRSGGAAVQAVGSIPIGDDVQRAALAMTEALEFEVSGRTGNVDDTFHSLRRRAEDLGILVMVNGVVGNNTHRRLDIEEFRGFAMSDALAPLVFVNNRDTGAGRVFTLVHELVHIWTGDTGVDQIELTRAGGQPAGDTEVWCNQVAAEVLVPRDQLRQQYRAGTELTVELERLRGIFRASTLVCLRAIYDVGYYRSWEEFRLDYAREEQRVRQLAGSAGSGGGNFYYTAPQRLSESFARAVICSTREGRTLYTDAYAMLGARGETFDGLAVELGVG